MRDQNFWKKVKLVLGTCSAMALSVPDMSAYGVVISQEDVDNGIERLGDAMECAYYDAKLKKELRYTMEGLYFEIITKKPFLLLTINEAIYEALEAKEMEILTSTGKTENDRLLGTLLKNMRKFFDLRAKFELMSNDYRNNTEKLYSASKKGVGDAWSTYKILADHTLRMNTALVQHVLSDKYEESEVRGVQKTLTMVGQDAITNQSLVMALRKDPANKALVDLVDTKYKHLRDIKQEVAEKAQNATENDKELLLRAYKKK